MIPLKGRVKSIDLGTEGNNISKVSSVTVLGSASDNFSITAQIPTELAIKIRLFEEVVVSIDFPNIAVSPAAPEVAEAEPPAAL